MTTLPEFLLARIAEDEAVAAAAATGYGPGGYDWGDAVSLSESGYFNSELPDGGVRLSHVRFAADCQAKRRIVDRSIRAESWIPTRDDGERAEINALRWALHALALPYADHPDYQQEWRP